MTVYVINIFEKEANLLVDTMVFASWKKAQKYFDENIQRWAELGCYANVGGEPLYFRCPKEN